MWGHEVSPFCDKLEVPQLPRRSSFRTRLRRSWPSESGRPRADSIRAQAAIDHFAGGAYNLFTGGESYRSRQRHAPRLLRSRRRRSSFEMERPPCPRRGASARFARSGADPTSPALDQATVNSGRKGHHTWRWRTRGRSINGGPNHVGADTDGPPHTSANIPFSMRDNCSRMHAQRLRRNSSRCAPASASRPPR